MISVISYAMVYLGAALMVYNIYGFVRYARYVRGQKVWTEGAAFLYIPVILLVMFLCGYLVVGIFGSPDLVIGGVFFFGSVFVFIMYKYLSSITQRILEREKLEAELAAVEESNQAKANFLAGISHEMRTPLNVILGMDALALKDPDLSPETRGRLEKINSSAQHLLGLINNMLDMNRIETGLLATKNEEFDLAEAISQVIVIAEALCEEKGLLFKVSVPEPKSGGCRYIGDETQLKRVLLSILDNAVKYTDAPGKVGFTAERVSVDGRLQTIRFTVSDTGIGMDADFIPKMFSAFEQEHASSTSRYGGGGLSMAVAKNIIELMGGSIQVESKKNAGTTFIVTVSLVCVEAPEVPVGESPASDSSGTLAGKRILIVEDLPENAEIVMDLLELEGMKCEHAENGQVAVNMVAQSPAGYYDAILMDLRMPVMDGLTATRAIRALDHPDATTVPIVALTANAFEEDVRQSLSAGMNAHLAKPTDADMLYDVLKRYIREASEPEGEKTI